MRVKEGDALPIRGAGAGKGGGSATGITEAPDTLRSSQKIVLLDAWGEGPVVGLVNGAQSIYFNKTPLQNADGSWNFNQAVVGFSSGTQGAKGISQISGLTIPGNSETISIGAQIFQASPQTYTITNPQVTAVRVTLMVPQLMSTDPKSGNISGTSVEFNIAVDTNGGGFVTVVTDTINGKTSSQYTRDYLVQLTGTGPWTIKVTRMTPDSGSTLLLNALYWQSITTIVQANLEYRHTALAAISIDAQQFGSIPKRAYDIKGLIVKVPSNYNPTTRTYTGTWDGTFQLAWTDNPAWCFYDLVTNERYGLGNIVDPLSIDKWTLYNIGQYCDQLVPDGFGGFEPRFTCNLMLNTVQEAYTAVQQFASIFRAIVYWSAGTIFVSQDSPSDPVQLFTPANVIGGAFNYQGTSVRARHTVAMVRWNDPSNFYEPAVEWVQRDDLVQKYGVIRADVTALGCTSRGQAHRVGQWLLYTEWEQTETITFRAAMDGMFLTPGDIIQTSDPNRAGSRMGGRIVSASGSTVTLDATPPAGASTFWLEMPDGTLFTSAVSFVQGNQIVLATALPQQPVPSAVYMLATNTTQPEQWRVISIAETAQNEVEISALAYNPGKFAQIEQTVTLGAASPSNLTDAPPTPTNLAFVTSAYTTSTGQAGLKGTLSWTEPPPGAASFKVTWRPASGALQSGTTTDQSYTINAIEDGVPYTFTVTAYSSTGIASATATLNFTPAQSQVPLQALPAPVNVTTTGGLFSVIIGWQIVTQRTDITVTEIWGSTTDDESTATLLASVPYPNMTWTQTNMGVGQTWYYWLRVRDKAGDAGPWSSSQYQGTPGSPSTDAHNLLLQLENQLGMQQLANELATPIKAIQPLQVSTQDLALAALQGALQNDSLAKTQNFQNAAIGATMAVDPTTGKISLVATAPISTDVQQQLNQLSTEYNAVSGSITTLNQSVTTTANNVTTLQSQIQQLQSEISQAVTAEYVTTSINAVLGDTTSLANQSMALGKAALQNILHNDWQANQQLAQTANVAYAQSQINANATALQAQAQSIQQLVAATNSNLAAIQTEQTARANADSALAQQISTLAAFTSEVSGSAQAAIQNEATARTSADNALSQQISTLSATVNANNASLNAALQNESTVRANADTALSQQITSLSSTVSGVSGTATALVNQEAATRAAADNALSQQINTVQTNVNGQLATVQQTLTAHGSNLSNLNAQYVLQVQAGQYVAGMQLAAGGGSSSFAVLADKFLIAQPSAGAQPKQAFVLGTVNGQTTVGIGGNMILDGAITANSAAIAQAAIGTLQLAGQAVTFPQGQTWVSNQVSNGTSLQMESFQVIVPQQSSPVLISYYTELAYPNGNYGTEISIMYVDANGNTQRPLHVLAHNWIFSWSGSVVLWLPPGTFTFTAYLGGAANNVISTVRTFSAIVLKR